MTGDAETARGRRLAVSAEQEIGTRLKQARVGARLTVCRAAEAVGVHRMTITRWEQGKSLPDMLQALALSDAYGISLDRIIAGPFT